jgi:hypothetical protein
LQNSLTINGLDPMIQWRNDLIGLLQANNKSALRPDRVPAGGRQAVTAT